MVAVVQARKLEVVRVRKVEVAHERKIEVVHAGGLELVVEVAAGLQVAFVGEVVPTEQHSYCTVPDPEFQNKFVKHGEKLVCWQIQAPDACFG